MLEIQVYEGGDKKCLLPGQMKAYGRNLVSLGKKVGPLSGKIRNPQISQSFLRYSGHLIAEGMSAMANHWDEVKMNSVQLYLSQIISSGTNLGFKEVVESALDLMAEHSVIDEVRRNP